MSRSVDQQRDETITAPIAIWTCPGRREPVGQPATAEQQRVEDQGRPERVGERDGQPPRGEVLGRRGGDHPGEDRPGARRVDEAETGAHDQARAEAVPAEAAGPGAIRDAKASIRSPIAGTSSEMPNPTSTTISERPGDVVGQAERVDHVDQRDRREGEGEGEPGDHAERAPATTRDPNREHGGQDRQHAGRECGPAPTKANSISSAIGRDPLSAAVTHRLNGPGAYPALDLIGVHGSASCRSSSCRSCSLPGERMPLHIFEERYKRMVGRSLDEGEPFGIVLRDDDGARSIGCTARVDEVLGALRRRPLNIVVSGEEPFKVLDRFEAPDYPAGEVERDRRERRRRRSTRTRRAPRARPSPSSPSAPPGERPEAERARRRLGLRDRRPDRAARRHEAAAARAPRRGRAHGAARQRPAVPSRRPWSEPRRPPSARSGNGKVDFELGASRRVRPRAAA